MSDDKKPPAFYCPACGQKHRADLQSLEERPGAVMRLACVGCAKPLRVTLDPTGLPVCATDEPAPEPPPAPAAPPAALPPAPTPRKRAPEAPVSSSRRRKERRGKERTGAEESGVEETAPSDAPAPEEAVPSPPPPVPGDRTIEAEFDEGTQIDRYRIERAIGRGGSSAVYSAFDPTTNRSVALKVLARDHTATMRQRFLREIEVQANIRHQNIMPVFDRGELPDGRPFFTMELLYDPWSLADIVRHREEGTLGRYDTLRRLGALETLVEEIVLPVVEGVYVANVENGVVHRDLKPDNILVDSRTLRPYVIDFGICQVLDRKGGIASKTVIPPTTEDEGIVGTPRFLAPEQVRGSAHARTDVWGLGAVLHYVVAGEPPLAAATSISRVELKRRIAALEETRDAALAKGEDHKVDLCEEKLARLRDPNLRTTDDLFADARDGKYTELPPTTPAPLRAVIAKAMALSTSERYVNARQLGADVQAWLAHGRVRALTEAGGKAAAVESARRAVRTHTATALWLVGGLLAGLGLASAFAKPGAAPPSTRLDDADQDIHLLDESLEGLSRVAESLTAVERNRLWTSLDARAAQIEARIENEPDVPQVRAIRERLDYVRSRFAPERIRLDLPAGVPVAARSLVTGGRLELAPGEVRLAPGAYVVTVADRVSFPLQLPLTVRTQQQAERIDGEPARETYALPIEPNAIPSGRVLVLGGRVLARNLPFAPPSTAPTDVASFLMDEREVTNAQYARFLSDLSPEERRARAPRAGFVPDPEQDGLPIVLKGRENAPVAAIRPEDARAYAAWRSRRDGARVRLPTEAEWVYAAGAAVGHVLPGGAPGYATDADLSPPLRDAGAHEKDVSEFGVRGLFGNAREMVEPAVPEEPEGAVCVKGAGVGDDPDQAAIYVHRVLAPDERHPTTGFRCVTEIVR